MVKDGSDVLQGTLDMLVLKALQLEPMHGWGIAERIEQWSERVLQLGQGSLYPALYRMERQDFIRSEWRVTDNNRRALLLVDRTRAALHERIADTVATHVARDQSRARRHGGELTHGCAPGCIRWKRSSWRRIASPSLPTALPANVSTCGSVRAQPRHTKTAPVHRQGTGLGLI